MHFSCTISLYVTIRFSYFHWHVDNGKHILVVNAHPSPGLSPGFKILDMLPAVDSNLLLMV